MKHLTLLPVSAFPDVHLQLRKRIPVYAIELLVGTDVQVVASGLDAAGRPFFSSSLAGYKPNLHVSCHDRILGGAVGLSTKNNELSYTKTYTVQGLELGVSALYNYDTCVPYAGFVLNSAPGVSTTGTRSNAFALNHRVRLEHLPCETELAFQGEVGLPGTRYDAKSGSLGLTGPIDIRLHSLTATLTV